MTDPVPTPARQPPDGPLTLADHGPAADAEPAPPLPSQEITCISDTTPAPAQHTPLPLHRLADYELIAEIGRGGMGVVFKARHVRLGRIVALKMILGGSLARADDLLRFETEAAAAAQLQHPNIVALYEAGSHDQQPYFSMEYVNGSSLAQRLALGTMPSRLAANYLEKTARAVHYAHSRGVIHRDLKPANVLLDEHDQPKITDFGLAKLLQTESGQTRTGAVIGTPSYMAPEQAAASKDLGPACDIYSLGAILYELLTGIPPFRGESALATLNLVAEAEPVSPHLLNPKVDADLETICLKCLEKEPARRYATAAALADDLRRYLDGEPITARRLGHVGRVLKWCRRKPTAATLLLVTVVTLLSIVGSLLAFSVHATKVAEEERDLRDAAEGQKQLAFKAELLAKHRLSAMDRLLYLGEMRQAHSAIDAANLDRAGKLLEHWRPSPNPTKGYSSAVDLREWEWYYLKNLCGPRFALWVPPQDTLANELAAPAWVTAVAYHPAGKQLASADGQPSKPGTIKIWDLNSGRVLHTLTGHLNSIAALAYSPDGKWLASASADRSVRLWEASSGSPLATLNGHGKHVNSVAFHPGGKLLASAGGDGQVHLWPLDRGLHNTLKPVRTLPGPESINSVAFSGPNGLLAAGGRDKRFQVHVWEVETWTLRRQFEHESEINSVAFNISGTLLAAVGGRGSKRGELKLWDVQTGKAQASYDRLSDRLLSVTFSGRNPPGVERWAVASSDGLVRIWETPTRGEPQRLRGDPQRVLALAFSPDGQRLAGAGRDGRVHLWNSDGGLETRLWPATAATQWIAFGPGGRSLATTDQLADASDQLFLYAMNSAKVQKLAPLPAAVNGLAYSADGRLLVTAGEDHIVRMYTLDGTGRVTATRELLGHSRRVTAVAIQPRGQLIASASDDETIRLYSVADGKLVRILEGRDNGVLAVAFSPNGEQLVSGSVDKTVRVWQVATGEHVKFEGHTGAVKAVAFHPNKQQVASAGVDRTIRVWDVATGKVESKLEGSAGVIATLAFHPLGRRLASAGEDRVVRLWDLVAGQEILELTGSTGSLTCVVFSVDGRYLACSGTHTAVRVWEAPGARGRP